MIKDIEGFDTEDHMQLFIEGKGTLDGGVECVEAWASDEVPTERPLANRKTGAGIGRYEKKCRRIQPPVSRHGLPVDISSAAMQVNGNAGNQVGLIELWSSVRQ